MALAVPVERAESVAQQVSRRVGRTDWSDSSEAASSSGKPSFSISNARSMSEACTRSYTILVAMLCCRRELMFAQASDEEGEADSSWVKKRRARTCGPSLGQVKPAQGSACGCPLKSERYGRARRVIAQLCSDLTVRHQRLTPHIHVDRLLSIKVHRQLHTSSKRLLQPPPAASTQQRGNSEARVRLARSVGALLRSLHASHAIGRVEIL